MHGCDARACKHGHNRLRNHRHIYDDSIAALDPQFPQCARKTRNLIEKLLISEAQGDSRYRAIVDECEVPATALFHVAVERVITGIDATAGKPAVKRRVTRV